MEGHVRYMEDILGPAKPYVGQNGIYVPSEVNCRYHKMLISRELFVEAYNKWIKCEEENESNS